jgi:phage baseplate assembly protein W
MGGSADIAKRCAAVLQSLGRLLPRVALATIEIYCDGDGNSVLEIATDNLLSESS